MIKWLGLPVILVCVWFSAMSVWRVSAADSVASLLHLPLVSVGAVSDGVASWSAPIALSPAGNTLWVVNPDADSVSVVDTSLLTTTAEIAVGREPWAVATSPDGMQVYVVNRGDGSLSVINASSHEVEATLLLGPEPGGIALSPLGNYAYIPLTAAGKLAVVDTTQLTITRQITLAALPYAVSVSDDGDADEGDERIVVTHLLAFPTTDGAEATDDGRMARVSILDAATLAVLHQVDLLPDEHGFPNLLQGVALAGDRAWIPQVRAAPALPAGLTTTVFAAVSTVNLTDGQEETAARLPLNDQTIFGSPVNNPVAAIPAPDGRTLYIVLAGSDLVEVVDIANAAQPRLVTFLPVGKNPRGLALSADGRRGYVMNYLSRSVTVLDLAQQQVMAEIPVTTETLSPTVLRGKILFNNAVDPRLSKGSWISCASCHPDGGSDGVTWIFPDGPRQTPPLWNAGQTLPWHWSAALDELQDVEETIQVIQHGLGLAPGADPPQLGAVNAGRSTDLDALAAFLQQGIRAPKLAVANDEVAEGRALFIRAGCAACHGGPQWTSSALPGPAGTLDADGDGMVDNVLHDVGTFNAQDIRGATGFDPPSLLGAALTAPYLHDGSMPTLTALLASGHPDPNGARNGLTSAEIVTLSAFLRTIDAGTPIIDLP